MGTRFTPHEARAGEAYKKAIGEIGSDGTTVTRCYRASPCAITNPTWRSRSATSSRSSASRPDVRPSQAGVMAALGGQTEGIERDRNALRSGAGDRRHPVRQEIVDQTMSEAEAVISGLSPLVG